jgi:hypothetical protein
MKERNGKWKGEKDKMNEGKITNKRMEGWSNT